MKRIIAVDVSSQGKEAVKAAEALRAADRHRTVVLAAGPHPRLDWWKPVTTGKYDCRVAPLTSVKAGAAVTLMGLVMSYAMNDRFAGYQWVVVGRNKIYEELVAELTSIECEAVLYPSINRDVADALLGGQEPLTMKVRGIYLELKETYGPDIHIGKLTKEVMEQLPAMRTAKFRQKMFGTKRFSRIARQCNLKVMGRNVVWAL